MSKKYTTKAINEKINDLTTLFEKYKNFDHLELVDERVNFYSAIWVLEDILTKGDSKGIFLDGKPANDVITPSLEKAKEWKTWIESNQKNQGKQKEMHAKQRDRYHIVALTCILGGTVLFTAAFGNLGGMLTSQLGQDLIASSPEAAITLLTLSFLIPLAVASIGLIHKRALDLDVKVSSLFTCKNGCKRTEEPAPSKP